MTALRVTLRGLVWTAVLACSLAGTLGQAQLTPPPDWKERFGAFDQNGDGRIDRAEFQEWMVDVFFQRDRGKKGYLTIEDVQGALTPEIFKALSRKGDGKLWLPDFLNALFLDFQAMDTDRVGSITMEQIEVYIRQR
jgi:Ca2+-binding EF-hand superfamily protein